MLMAPFFAILFGPVQTVAIIILMEIVVTAQLLPGVRREIRWKVIAPMGIAAALLMPAGSWLLVTLDPDFLARFIALVVLAFSIILMIGWRYDGEKKAWMSAGVGALSGVLIASTSLGNPPVMVYLLSGRDSAATNRANFTGYFALTLVALIAMMAFTGLIDPRCGRDGGDPASGVHGGSVRRFPPVPQVERGALPPRRPRPPLRRRLLWTPAVGPRIGAGRSRTTRFRARAAFQPASGRRPPGFPAVRVPAPARRTRHSGAGPIDAHERSRSRSRPELGERELPIEESRSMIPGIVLGAPASGSGKTTVTLALLRHLRDRGVRAGSLKVGPDYIDPAFHTAASGRTCLNVDPWAMREATFASAVAAASKDADLVVVEGVMGLFDGATAGEGSTADVAAAAGWPVVLVVDASAMAGSAAAVVHGFASYRADVDVAGVIYNRVGSDRHAELLVEATVGTGVPVLGCIRRDHALTLPDRHLGLVQASEHPDLERFLAAAATAIGTALDVEALLRLARRAPLATPAGPGGSDAGRGAHRGGPAVAIQGRARGPDLLRAGRRGMAAGEPDTMVASATGAEADAETGVTAAAGPRAAAVAAETAPSLPVLGQRIAVARDEAFAFAYPLVLDGWRHAGVEVLPFSPLANEPPSPLADAVYLPGGYPELHAGRLAAARRFIEGVRSAAARGAVVYGECGGYMVLGESLVDADGEAHAMAGLLPVTTTFAERGLTLGYRVARALARRPPRGVSARAFAGTSSTTRGCCARTAIPPSSAAPTRAAATSVRPGDGWVESWGRSCTLSIGRMRVELNLPSRRPAGFDLPDCVRNSDRGRELPSHGGSNALRGPRGLDFRAPGKTAVPA